MTDRSWHKSSYSGGSGGNCVEVKAAEGVRVRDTKRRDGAELRFSPSVWCTFIATVKR